MIYLFKNSNKKFLFQIDDFDSSSSPTKWREIIVVSK